MTSLVDQRSRPLCVLILALVVGVLAGCSDSDEEIRVYRIPKREKTRILAAMIPHGTNVWIFKVDGSDAKVESFQKSFLGFLRTVKFEDDPDADPQWKLPEGWGQLPDDHPRNIGSFPRYATVYKDDVRHEERMEVAISSLPMRIDIPWQRYVKLNVDRWRGQLKLPEVNVFELDKFTEEVPLGNGLVATTVNFVEADKEEKPVEDKSAKKTEAKLPFKYAMPAGWSSGGGSALSLLAFQVADGGRKVEITVTPAGGELLPNVNRWRVQVGLDQIDAAQLAKELKELDAGETKFNYVELAGAQETILAAVGSHGGRMWFVKLKGDSELARRETANFESFVKSMRFES